MSPDDRRRGNVSEVDPDSLGGQIRRYRERAGLSQGQLGDAIGVSQGRVSEYELNKRVPGEDAVYAIARALNVLPGVLYESTRWGGALPIGEEVRDIVKLASPEDWRVFVEYLDTTEGMTPELRTRFLQGYRNFLELWNKK